MYYLLLHSAGAVPLPLNTGTSTVAMSNIVLHSPPHFLRATICCVYVMFCGGVQLLHVAPEQTVSYYWLMQI